MDSFKLIDATKKDATHIEAEIRQLIENAKDFVSLEYDTIGDYDVPNFTMEIMEARYRGLIKGFKLINASEELIRDFASRSFLVTYKVAGVKVGLDVVFYRKHNAWFFESWIEF